MRYIRCISLLAVLLVLSMSAPAFAGFEVPETAYGEGAFDGEEARVETRLIVDAEQVAPGETIRVGVAFALDSGWHIYWQDPGDAGVPTDIRWSSDDLTFGPLQWATPETFTEGDGELTVYGYGDEVVLFSEATVDPDARGPIEIAAKIEYLACSNLCLPGHSRLRRTLPVAERTAPARADVLAAFDEAAGETTAASSAAALAQAGADDPEGEPAEGGDKQETSLVWMLLMAFLGGMILNLMPCVFPVLALKVSSFTRLVHEDKRGVLSHGMAYTAGIVGSMLALAGVVVGLRMAGTEVGWGFQFQNPHFLAVLGVILVLFALNLFGVFEVTANSRSLHEKAQHSSGVRRSFWEGILAVVLATPCSAPFLGTAVGFALSSSALTIVGVFTALGLGLAAPFVVLTLVPGWAKVLPRPGSWMEVLKKLLGFALLGSGIWIVWLLGRQTGVDGMASVLVFLGVLSLAAWLYGLVQFQRWSWKKVVAGAFAIGSLSATAIYTFPLEADATRQVETSGAIEWKEWSERAVQAELAKGRPVFVDFTADWCLTCKVNEKNAIDTAPVRRAMGEYDVAMFKADWTNPDERIRKKLAEFGKAGVPFYLMYAPRRPDEPRPLPEVITSETVVEAFETAARDQ